MLTITPGLAAKALRNVINQLAAEGIEHPFAFKWQPDDYKLHAVNIQDESHIATVWGSEGKVVVEIEGRVYEVAFPRHRIPLIRPPGPRPPKVKRSLKY